MVRTVKMSWAQAQTLRWLARPGDPNKPRALSWGACERRGWYNLLRNEVTPEGLAALREYDHQTAIGHPFWASTAQYAAFFRRHDLLQYCGRELFDQAVAADAAKAWAEIGS